MGLKGVVSTFSHKVTKPYRRKEAIKSVLFISMSNIIQYILIICKKNIKKFIRKWIGIFRFLAILKLPTAYYLFQIKESKSCANE